jgi:hypothetical protein
VPATAKPYRRPSCEAEWLPFWVNDLELALDADGSVMIHRDFGRRHFFSREVESMTLRPHLRDKSNSTH